MANLFNIKISIFTYGGLLDEWSKIYPDPELGDAKLGKLIPDVALYHSFNCHFVLLVKEDSRLALLGLLADSSQANPKEENKVIHKPGDDWQKLKNRKKSKEQ